jgi:enamine deaminase RidA (YjgF/YER057c/UK114 family)
VLKTTIFVSSSSRDDLTAAWNEVVGGFGDHDPPSTLLGVGALGYPGQLVEIEAIAVAAPREPRCATIPGRRVLPAPPEL